MNKRSPKFLLISAAVFVVLFTYTATSKLADFDTYRGEMLNQALPLFMNQVLVWFMPLSELSIAGLLLFSKTRAAGLAGSFILMLLFTGYVGLVYFNFFERVPCSCGGIFDQLGWGEHFIINTFFLCLSMAALFEGSKKIKDKSRDEVAAANRGNEGKSRKPLSE